MTRADLTYSQITATRLPRVSRSRDACLFRLLILLEMLLFFDASARADGIDIVPFVTRVGGWRVHPVLSVALVVGMMLVNYLVNVAVIGVPAAKVSRMKLRIFARDLVGFTLLAQIADRVSAVAGLVIGLLVIDGLRISGEEGLAKGILLGVALNFVFAGLAIGFLALRYLRRRWGISKRPARVIAIAAGVITNPAWLVAAYLANR
jgi:hypothetical protein